MATATPSAGLTLTLTEQEAKIVRESLADEWDYQAKEAAAEVNRELGNTTSGNVGYQDAAWKVRRQASIVDILERLGWED